MNERARKRRDFIQNITIALLCVTAVLLFAQTQIYGLGLNGGLLSFLSGNDLPASSSGTGQTSTALTAPVRVAAASSIGRFGSVTFTTDDDNFESLRGLLEQALDSARDYTASGAPAFFQALDGPSVYYDFLAPLPLSVLGELVRSEGTEELSARRLILSAEEDGVVLYLWDGGSGYFRCHTAISPDTLETTISQYELGNAFFAYESTDPNAQYVDPYSLFLENEPALPELSVSVPLSDTDRLLVALDFNPNTQFRYADASGAEVVREGGRTLRIHPDGTITYQSGGSQALTLTGEEASLLEAVTAANTLLHNLLDSSSGDAKLYLEGLERSDDGLELRFGYQVGGVPIRFAGSQSAAEITLSQGAISSMTIRIRQYTVAGTGSLLLPLRQALAIAAEREGAELFIGYADQGAGTTGAGWLAE